MAQVTSPIILDSTGQQIHSDLQQIKNVLTTPSAAEDITFDNTGTGMQADDVQDAITELKSNLTELDTIVTKINRQPISGTMNIYYNSSTQLMGDVDLSEYNSPTPPTFSVLVVAGTPYGQVSRCLVGAQGNNKYRFYVQGTGFVSGHTLQIVWYSSEKVN